VTICNVVHGERTLCIVRYSLGNSVVDDVVDYFKVGLYRITSFAIIGLPMESYIAAGFHGLPRAKAIPRFSRFSL